MPCLYFSNTVPSFIFTTSESYSKLLQHFRIKSQLSTFDGPAFLPLYQPFIHRMRSAVGLRVFSVSCRFSIESDYTRVFSPLTGLTLASQQPSDHRTWSQTIKQLCLLRLNSLLPNMSHTFQHSQRASSLPVLSFLLLHFQASAFHNYLLILRQPRKCSYCLSDH